MKRFVRAMGMLVVALLLLGLGLAFFLNANQFRPMLEAELTRKLGREVKLGDLKLALFSGGITASNLSIADNPVFSQAPFLRAKSLHAGVEMMPLLMSRELHVIAITVEDPQIMLLQSASGDWNFSSLGGAKSAPVKTPAAPESARLDLSVKLIKITNGRMSIGNTKSNGKPQVFENLNAEVQDFSSNSVFPFSVSTKAAGGAEIKLHGRAGPIDSTDASLTALEASLAIKHFELADSGFTGLLTIEANGSSNGRKLQAKGNIKAEHWKVANNGTPALKPVEVDFAVDHDIRNHAGMLSRGAIHVGKVAAALAGSYNLRGNTPHLKIKFTGTRMPIPELAAMLPALGIVLPAGSSLQGGTASANLTLEGPADQLVTAGIVSLDETRLAGFDLGSKLKTIAAIVGIPAANDTEIKTFSADIRRGPEGTRAESINLAVPAIGEFTGDGSISPAHDLDFKMHATIHTSGGVMAVLSQSGDTSIPFFIRGTGSAPSFIPDAKGIAKEQVNTFLKRDDTKKAVKGLLDNLFGRKKP